MEGLDLPLEMWREVLKFQTSQELAERCLNTPCCPWTKTSVRAARFAHALISSGVIPVDVSRPEVVASVARRLDGARDAHHHEIMLFDLSDLGWDDREPVDESLKRCIGARTIYVPLYLIAQVKGLLGGARKLVLYDGNMFCSPAFRDVSYKSAPDFIGAFSLKRDIESIFPAPRIQLYGKFVWGRYMRVRGREDPLLRLHRMWAEEHGAALPWHRQARTVFYSATFSSPGAAPPCDDLPRTATLVAGHWDREEIETALKMIATSGIACAHLKIEELHRQTECLPIKKLLDDFPAIKHLSVEFYPDIDIKVWRHLAADVRALPGRRLVISVKMDPRVESIEHFARAVRSTNGARIKMRSKWQVGVLHQDVTDGVACDFLVARAYIDQIRLTPGLIRIADARVRDAFRALAPEKLTSVVLHADDEQSIDFFVGDPEVSFPRVRRLAITHTGRAAPVADLIRPFPCAICIRICEPLAGPIRFPDTLQILYFDISVHIEEIASMVVNSNLSALGAKPDVFLNCTRYDERPSVPSASVIKALFIMLEHARLTVESCPGLVYSIIQDASRMQWTGMEQIREFDRVLRFVAEDMHLDAGTILESTDAAAALARAACFERLVSGDTKIIDELIDECVYSVVFVGDDGTSDREEHLSIWQDVLEDTYSRFLFALK